MADQPRANAAVPASIGRRRRLYGKAKANFLQGDDPGKQAVEELSRGYVARYERWDTARPGAGTDAKAKVWRKKLDALKKDGAQPAAEVLSGK